MADELLRIAKSDSLIFWGFVIMVFGSIVDIFQFSVLVKKHYQRWRRRIYNRAKDEAMFELMKREYGKSTDPDHN